MKLIAVANPLLVGGGGTYRARKSLLNYTKHGIETHLILPIIDKKSYDEEIISELERSGVRLHGSLGSTSERIFLEKIRTALFPIIPRAFVHADLGSLPRDADVVVSLHETYDALLSTNRIASRIGKPSVAFLQLPLFYSSKKRMEAISRAIELYYDFTFGGSIIKKETALFYHETVEKLNRSAREKALKEMELIVGISRAVCVEMGAEESSRVHCMDPGVSLDEEDLKEIQAIRSSVREKKGYLVFGGRPVAAKGIVEVLLAFKKIAEKLPDRKLLFTGRIRSSVAERIKRAAKKIGVDEKIVFTGFLPREERLRAVREAAAVLYPSHADAYPYAVAESLLLGTPVIAYNIPAVEIYFGKLSGVRAVEELDTDALAEEALEVLSRSRVEVEPPRLRSWEEIMNEEASLIERAAGARDR